MTKRKHDSSTSGGEKSENRITVCQALGERFLVSLHGRETERVGRETCGVPSSFIKALNPLWGPRLKYLPKALPPNTITLWGRVLTCEPGARGTPTFSIQDYLGSSKPSNLHETFRTAYQFLSKPFIINDDFFQTYRLILERIHIKKIWNLFVNENYIFFHWKIFRSFKI